MIGSLGDPPDANPDDWPYKHAVKALTFGGTIYVIATGMSIFGLFAVCSFYPRCCRIFWILEVVQVFIYVVLPCILYGWFDIVASMIILGLWVWWVSAIKSLADRKQLRTHYLSACLQRTVYWCFRLANSDLPLLPGTRRIGFRCDHARKSSGRHR
jgi:hypothetical protein